MLFYSNLFCNRRLLLNKGPYTKYWADSNATTFGEALVEAIARVIFAALAILIGITAEFISLVLP